MEDIFKDMNNQANTFFTQADTFIKKQKAKAKK